MHFLPRWTASAGKIKGNPGGEAERNGGKQPYTVKGGEERFRETARGGSLQKARGRGSPTRTDSFVNMANADGTEAGKRGDSEIGQGGKTPDYNNKRYIIRREEK